MERGAASKAIDLVKCESSHRQFLIRAVSISDARLGNEPCSARK